MALVVEDGTGLATANSYIDISFADSYHSDRANASWGAALVGAKTAALIAAAAFLDARYERRFNGYRLKATQALAWPRGEAYDRDDNPVSGVPGAIKAAAAEAALRALAAPLAPDMARGGMVEEVQAGPVRKKFMAGAPAETSYPAISGRLAPLLVGHRGVRITR